MNYSYFEIVHGILWAMFIFGMFASLLHSYGFENHIKKKRSELSKLQQKIFEAQRKGDLRLAGELSLKAEKLEEELVNKNDM